MLPPQLLSLHRLSVVASVLKHRVVQFAVLGGALFAASAFERRGERTISLASSELGALRREEARRQGRAGNSPRLGDAVEERAIEDEVLYREGLALGFDKNDAIVRGRVIQKTLFLAEELAGAGEPPSDTELRQFFESTREDWKRPEHFHFLQTFSRDRRAIDDIAARAAAGEDAIRLGDPCALPREVSGTGEWIASMMGTDFVRALAEATPRAWSAPIPSALGWHLVLPLEHAPAAPATFDEVKDKLRGVYVVRRREQAVASFLQQGFAHYRVLLDGRRVDALHPEGRVAIRKASSGED